MERSWEGIGDSSNKTIAAFDNKNAYPLVIRRPQPFAGGARPRKSGFAAPLAAQQHLPALLAAQQQVLWPPAGRFPFQELF